MKTVLVLVGLWILAQAVAWFYGGKDAAATIAVLSALAIPAGYLIKKGFLDD